MDSERKRILLNQIEEQIAESSDNTQNAVQVAIDFSDASPSQSGDRHHYEVRAQQLRDTLEALRALKEEILRSEDTPRGKASPLSFVAVEFEDGAKVEFLFSEISRNIPGLKIISPEAPLGTSILNKKEGEEFSYSIKQQGIQKTYKGKIIKIE